MRYAWIGLAIVLPACDGTPDDAPAPDALPLDGAAVVDAADVGGDAIVPTCGDDAALPPEVTRTDERTHTVSCDGAATALAITTLDDGIVRLRYGAPGPEPLVPVERPLGPPTLAGRRGEALVVCTPSLEISVVPGSCALVAKDREGRVVLEDRDGGAFFTAEGEIGVARRLAEGERVYGLGLHTAKGLDLRGARVDLWNTDAYVDAHKGFPPDAPNLYESLPFYVSLRERRALGVFTHDTHRMRFEIGAAAAPNELRAVAKGGAIDQYLLPGPELREVLRRHSRVTGRMPMPAPWAIGFHQSRLDEPCDGAPSERPFCSAAQVLEVAKRFRDAKIPADGIFLDIQHMRGFRTFTFDPIRFAAPDDLFAKLGALGFHAHAIVDPGIKIDPGWDVYAAGLEGGHYLKSASGAPYEGVVWPGPSVYPDFSAAKTRAWWSKLAGGMVGRGVSGLWIDMNEPANFAGGTVPDEVTCDGDGRATTMAELHNAYAFFEAKATFEGMKEAAPTERPFILSRAAFAGSQRYAAVWTGDAPSTWTSLSMTLPMLLQLGMSGMPFAGSDVGGYSGREESTPELFARWMALGSISPFFRAHAEKDAKRQEPWSFGREVEDASRALIGWRYELSPYLYSVFHEASETGAPILRPLVFEFQDDPRTHAIADQAMLGPSLLVAPILAKGARERSLYLPSGRWFELHSGASHDGGKTLTLTTDPEPLPLDALPMFAREGAIVPRTVRMAHAGEKPDAPLLLDVFSGARAGSFVLYEDDGKAGGASSRTLLSFEPTGDGARLRATREGTYTPKHERTVLRLRRVDRGVGSVKLDGVTLAKDAYSWDANARSLVVDLGARATFTLEVVYDKTLDEDGTVKVPITVQVPAGTSTSTAIHVASSAWGWTHRPLDRTGDVATGTLEVPRGKWFFYKVTRGAWSTVEKDATCAERSNRSALGGAAALAVTVERWADGCP
ncbi:MAG: hypothetical protein HYV09_24385 [Deltaproteobacteria bacterium]|nr:hypothetical protein [Deltaproteobacteria bacterium]